MIILLDQCCTQKPEKIGISANEFPQSNDLNRLIFAFMIVKPRGFGAAKNGNFQVS